ncbi:MULTISPECIES: sugar ABC transporter ATP-binding protein [Bacillales]|jgi:ABC-type sugar transport system ATPase subunit|uniref:ABC transporter n=1 Tax=Brevibacillus aydinogluensis TaxID=927786 RepID=A0AA48M8P8_9BACL|nr:MULTISPECIES: sugar ABC transporter ATP-binding protein [Bacillales]MBR8659383.1 sugar ABC transporter ATP-binding protein [Brevibacillus sp. NL20B1]MDT3414452.1 ABC-type sugar transport system ATPase subunit [Brevibacillus aydinogluensis]NNV02535.1 sugar ABC transporter ATP-binding protein [Brevibacillus sp. MCWH]UFJ60037.1 sugar ABC transporter ATP-binding protein [Anoxybacillus sediminis]CAJ1003329.1 ABC transporter [Brevibacillus aydinogluensis]
MQPYLLEMKHISKTFPGVKALDDVQLAVRAGEVHALIGENGAGKSTLIKILAGVYHPDPGSRFFFDGKEVEIKKPLDATLQGISIIYQDLSLFPNLSVAENICMGRDAGKGPFRLVKRKEKRELAARILNEWGFGIDPDARLDTLSIAKQQLVAIARAIAFEAKLIIMDEPTSSLSSGEVELLYKVIDDLKRKGIAILFVSHKMEELFKVSDRFTVLRDGKYVGTYAREELNEDKLIALMVGRKVEAVSRQETQPGEPVLEVVSLSKRGHFKDVSFTLRKGEVVGITGLVGSGRTELAHALFGLQRPDAGEIRLNGNVVNISSTAEAVKLGIAYVPESRQREGLILQQSIVRNVSLPILKQLKNRLGWIDGNQEAKLAEGYIRSLDIRPAIPEMATGNMSGGNQQKVVIAKWLSTNPRILIVDEPTNGIDIGAKTEIHKLIRSLAANGLAVIVISSDLPEVLAVSDRVLVMRKGTISGELSIKEATQEKIMNLALIGRPKAKGNEAVGL